MQLGRQCSAIQIGILMLLIVCRPQIIGADTVASTAQKRAVTFRYVPPKSARTVCVAGTFNGWNKSSDPLTLQSDGKTWQTTLSLAPGSYQYRFVVNSDTWLSDPNAPGVDDGNSNINSLLVVTPLDFDRKPGVVGDGIITGSAVRHVPTRQDILRLDAARFLLSLRTRHNDVASCRIVVPSTEKARLLPMTRYDGDALYDYWRGVTSLPAHGPLRYAFQLEDGPQVDRYDASGRLLSGKMASRWFRIDPAAWPTLRVPDWPRDAVFYQIFPDRFADGDTSNDGKEVKPWGTKPTYYNRMGGDLAGVMQHLDYLQDLGVNALYFTPIFTAESNHGYDTDDYLHIDPRFGTNEQLKQLVDRAHTLGWHVLLDGVFNHTGVNTAAFRSLREEGPRSSYRSWYFVKKFPIEVREGQQTYVSWFGVPSLPKLNLANPTTRAYMLNVATYWIRTAGIDGWRLDSADQVSPDYWVDFRRTVRQANPNSYLVGEIWSDAHPWLQGDMFDSVMNYRWRSATLDFFVSGKLAPTQFATTLTRIRDDYPSAATAEMFNLLGSHDTVRLRTLCQGDWSKERQAVLFQMTYPGTPCIYYGDEIGMEGGPDPDDRRCMVWDRSKWNEETHAFYKQILALRHAHAVLRRGTYRTVLADDARGLFGFERDYGRQHALVLFNRTDRSQEAAINVTELGFSDFHDWLQTKPVIRYGLRDCLLVSLPARGIALLGSS